MISHEYKCIFIHIPKCAGTSIESALGHLDGHAGRHGQDHRPIRMIEKPLLSRHVFTSKENFQLCRKSIKHQKRTNVHNYRNKLTVTKEQYETYYKFTVVRNPWARAFSWYKNVMRDEMHRKNNGITFEMTFNQFLKEYMGKSELRPQTYWLKNYKGQIDLDYIGKFEKLQDTFKKIKRSLNLIDIEFPHKLKGSGEDYKSKYDKKTIDIVKEFYREEIRLFHYTFDE